MLTRTDLSICIVSTARVTADKADVALYGLSTIHELAVLEEFSQQLRYGCHLSSFLAYFDIN
jgi:hypothetical protein